MKKILISVMTLVLVVGMVGAGAFAYFNDTETSSGNTFTAGILDLGPGSFFVDGETGYYSPNTHSTMNVIPGGNGANGKVVFSNIKPGDSGKIWWSVKNIGTIPGFLNLYINRSVDSDNGITEPEDMVDGVLNSTDGTAEGDLDDWMHIQLVADLDGNGTYETILQNGSGMGELETYLPVVGQTYKKLSNHPMDPGDVVNFQFAWRIDPDIAGVDDNIIQGDEVVLDLTFVLLQVAD